MNRTKTWSDLDLRHDFLLDDLISEPLPLRLSAYRFSCATAVSFLEYSAAMAQKAAAQARLLELADC
jgi:hypothetical protein